jgi:hypothetical protein
MLPSTDATACGRLLLTALLLVAAVRVAAPDAAAQAAEGGAHAALPHALERALDAGDPSLLASAGLPRLSDLGAEQRAALAERLEGRGIPERVAAYAFLQVGTPYRLGPLGEGAPPDTDAVIAFGATDCTALNLVSTALAHARDAGGERAAMAVANYRGGVVTYATRFHFTTDRLDSCRWFADITRQVGGMRCRSRVVTLNRRADGSRWIDIDWSRKRQVVFVPRGFGAELAREYDRGRIPAAMGIAFVEAARLSDGLDVVHESLLWKGRTLVHASSAAGRVVAVPWSRFLAEHGGRYDGFVLFAYR